MLPIAMVEGNTRAGNPKEYWALEEVTHFVRYFVAFLTFNFAHNTSSHLL
jgi:hypothetical protein